MRELTKAEEQIMQVLWRLGRGLVKDILDELPEPKPAYNTVSTIVRILEKKGFVSYKAYGKTHEYFPLVTMNEYRRDYLKSLVTSLLRELLPGARVVLRPGPQPDAGRPRGDPRRRLARRSTSRKDRGDDRPAVVPGGNRRSALAVFYAAVPARPEERHPFPDEPALPAGVAGGRPPAAARPRHLAVPASRRRRPGPLEDLDAAVASAGRMGLAAGRFCGSTWRAPSSCS